MPDYRNAFLKGIEAAKNAEQKRQEIAAVVKAFSDEIKSATEETIEIQIREFTIEPNNPFEINLLKPRETYEAIIALNLKVPGPKYKKLAIWKEGREGYPCIIEYNERKVIAEDKESLEQALETMLEDSLVGERIFIVLNYKGTE